MTLLVCRTCPRYDTPNNGEFRRALDARIAQNPAADPRTVRHVQCLGGCPEDGVAAVDGPGKARVRFNGLTADDADALVEAALAHAACPTGAPDEWDVPTELVDKVSSVTYKRGQAQETPAHSPRAGAQMAILSWPGRSRLSRSSRACLTAMPPA
jgi:predicted metal-binding protein